MSSFIEIKMSVLLKYIYEKFTYVFYELNDERTRDIWPNCPTLATILLAYLYFCMKAGPAWMKDKQPYELKNTILVYNIFQVIINTYLFYQGLFNVWLPEYDWRCQPVDYTLSPIALKTTNLVWMYTVLKLIELLDTVFFVLRKKTRQISSLHVYHHFMMPICAWGALKYYPNGHGLSLGVINCFIHMVMYAYYLIAGLGPEYQKYVWWKKHVTILQLVQFVIIFFHNMYPLLTGCDYPKWINAVLSVCALHFVYMFGNFYYQNYIKCKPIKCETKLKLHHRE